MISHGSFNSEIPPSQLYKHGSFWYDIFRRPSILSISANACLECLRDIGLKHDALKVAHPVAKYSTYHRICKTITGEEFSRAYIFDNDIKRHVRSQP